MCDDEGTDFESVEAALRSGVLSAGEIGPNRLVKGDTSDVVVLVRDERNQRVCTVSSSMKIERHSA